MMALSKATTDKKYLFVFFYKDGSEKTQALRKIFNEALAKAPDKASTITVNLGDVAEKTFIAKYGVAKAPMPLALAIAPNGAVTGGFPGKFDEKDLIGTFASPGKEKCLKALQEKKLVIVSAQNNNTKFNAEANKGIQDFKADNRYAALTAIILVDPADPAEARLMEQFKIDPKTQTSVTVLMAPPASLVTTIQGKVTKDALVAALNPPPCNCGPGGCK